MPLPGEAPIDSHRARDHVLQCSGSPGGVSAYIREVIADGVVTIPALGVSEVGHGVSRASTRNVIMRGKNLNLRNELPALPPVMSGRKEARCLFDSGAFAFSDKSRGELRRTTTTYCTTLVVVGWGRVAFHPLVEFFQ